MYVLKWKKVDNYEEANIGDYFSGDLDFSVKSLNNACKFFSLKRIFSEEDGVCAFMGVDESELLNYFDIYELKIEEGKKVNV